MSWFGLPAVEDSPATWGARAIDDGRTFGLLGDRQSALGEPEHRKALVTVLNDMGVMAKCQERFGQMKSTGEIRGDKANLVTLYEDWFVKVEANTNGSHGYVYLRAYIKPAGYTCERVKGYREDLPEGQAVWSCDELPKVGEVVYSSSWTSEDNLHTVLGYTVEHGHLFVVAKVNKPTDKWKAQQATGLEKEGRVSYMSIMGREWARPSIEANGYCEVADTATLDKIRDIEDRDVRRETLRRHVRTRSERHGHITEVYMVLFRKDQGAMLVNRQYTPVGTLPVEEAKALVARSVVGSTWEDYSLSNVPNSKGMAVWIAHPGSSDTRTWEAKDSAAVVAAL